MTLSDFLNTRYVKHGRVAPDLDCWGLVRLARLHLFGKSLLPSYSHIEPVDKEALTEAAAEVEVDFKEVEPKAGAIVEAWRGSLCVHVGIVVEVDDRLFVLETDVTTGPTLTKLNAFESRYNRVVYYDD